MMLTTETSQITEINLSAAEIDEKRSGGNEMHSGEKRRPGVTPVGNCARLCSTANPSISAILYRVLPSKMSY